MSLNTSKLDLFYSSSSVKAEGEKWKKFPSCVLLNMAIENLSQIKNLKIYPDDIFLCGFPRSGTTLMQEMIWLIVNGFNYEKAKSELKDLRFPSLETIEIFKKIHVELSNFHIDTLQRPRTIKTHLPVQFLPDDYWKIYPKTIYISRDPRDVVMSTFNISKNIFKEKSSMEEFLQNFLNDKIVFCPYREHCIDFWNIPEKDNILYLTYEWVNQNIAETILKVVKFLGKEISEENLKLLKEHLKIENMRKNDSCNRKELFKELNVNSNPEDFIRKGKSGNYKDEMPEEFIEKFKIWMEEFKEMKSSFENKN
ncbi:hypothetical protein PVAND_017427 [Polypedilum vanderplanki]|uniref:Sulfotransferase domain-containing protein n=1 Tax=Polypedilum vanderplanki TaxID=319348 RepID=A0A9J6BI91_POLVA|nr:hypothetical protein PVAND_017427 [Polypedilum vanderplanki]